MELYDVVLVEVKYHATSTGLSLETGHDIQVVLVKEQVGLQKNGADVQDGWLFLI
jgi:hypothetical protein